MPKEQLHGELLAGEKNAAKVLMLSADGPKRQVWV